MGSRERNFYNQLARRYGFETEAQEIQDLYLSGRKTEPAVAIPEKLIDMVSLCGPRHAARESLDAFRQASVGVLLVAPMALTSEDRLEQLRTVVELAAA